MMQRKKWYYRCHCLYMVEDEHKIWFFCNSEKSLCETDKITNKTKVLAFIDRMVLSHGFFSEDYSYAGIEKINKKIVLVPRSAKKIVIYDLEEKKIEYVDFEEADKSRKLNYYEDWKFEKSISYGEYVYLFPATYTALIILNVYTKEIVYLKDWIIEIEKNIIDNSWAYIRDSYLNGTKIWLSSGCSNLMICFDIIKWTFEFYNIPIRSSGLGAFAYDGKNFWIMEKGEGHEKVLKWNVSANIVKEFELSHDLKSRNEVHSIIFFNNKLLFFPFCDSKIYELDIETEKIIVNETLNRYIQGIGRVTELQVLCTKIFGNTLRFITGYDLIWHEYTLNKECISYEVILDEKEKKKKRLIQEFDYEKQQNITFYEKYLPLDLYLDCNMSNIIKSNVNLFEIGKGIYWEILRVRQF